MNSRIIFKKLTITDFPFPISSLCFQVSLQSRIWQHKTNSRMIVSLLHGIHDLSELKGGYAEYFKTV